MIQRLVTIREVCALLAGEGQPALTRARVSQLVADGMPREARGLYDPLKCMHWYLGKLRPALQRGATESDNGKMRNLTDEKARLVSAQADTAEMDRDERVGRLVPIDHYRERMTNWAITTKQLILGVPARLAPKLEGMPRAKIRIALDEAMKKCLVAISTGAPGPADSLAIRKKHPRGGKR